LSDLKRRPWFAVTELNCHGNRQFSGHRYGFGANLTLDPMRPTVAEHANPLQLRPGVQPELSASSDDQALAIQLELVSILYGPAFHSSSKSQAFLRFVVEECLSGREDSLKERTIGAALMGKPSDYDTGSDATVRVRANEVRKRLAAHYDAAAPKAGIRIELPHGTYVPEFNAVALAQSPLDPAPAPRPLALWQLATPTLIAIFLALVAIRGGVESDDAFSRFWDHAMAGRNAISVVPDGESESAVPSAVAEAAMPIERLADAFQMPVRLATAGSKIASGAFVIHLSLSRQAARAEPCGSAARSTRVAPRITGSNSQQTIRRR
jgi:hypothetical protein